MFYAAASTYLCRAAFRIARPAVFSKHRMQRSFDMRPLLGLMLAALLFTATPAAADYGTDLCNKYLPPGTPCTCVGDILDDEFDEEELDPLLQFVRAFTSGLGGDEAAAQKTIDRLTAQHTQAMIEGWLKRFEALSPQTEKACMFKF
jgi:hypothetical protein